MNREDWNERYRGSDLLWSAEPNRFLVEEVESLAPGRALDIACGEGRNAVWLAQRGFGVDAVDFSDVALERARALATDRGVEVSWIAGDVESYGPAPRAYDLVLLFYLHLPWQRMCGVLDRARDALRPGGTLLLVGHDLSNLESGYGGPKSPAVLYSPGDVAAAWNGLEIVEAARRKRPVEVDGQRHTAIDCLVRAVLARASSA